MIEKFDVYNAQKIKIGTEHFRGLKLPKGQFRFCVTVVIYNSKGELLLQKRAENKSSWPNYWTFGASGSVIAGETLAAAAQRELQEELGLDIDFTEIPSRLTVSFEEGWDEIFMIQQEVECSELTLQKEEVADAAWFTRAEFMDLLEQKKAVPQIFAYEIFDYIDSTNEYLSHKTK